MLRKRIFVLGLVPVLVFAGTGFFQTGTPAPAATTAGSAAGVPVSAQALLGTAVANPSGQGLGTIVDLVVDTGTLAEQAAASGSGVNTSAQGPANAGAAGQAAGTAAPAAAPNAPSAPSMGNTSVAPLIQGHGQVLYAVVGVGGFLGIGQTRTAVPWRLLAYRPQQGSFVLDAGPSRLAGAPGFRPPADGGALAPNWDQPVRSYWLNGAQASATADCSRLLQRSMDPVRPSIQPGPWYGLGNSNVAGVGAANSFEGNEPGLGLGASRALDDVVSEPVVGTFGDGVTPADDSVVAGCMPPNSPTVAANLAPSRASLGTLAANPFFNNNGGNQAPSGNPNAANGGTGTAVLASVLLGSTVRDASGANAGTLSDMILEASTSAASAAAAAGAAAAAPSGTAEAIGAPSGTAAAETGEPSGTAAAAGAGTGTPAAGGATEAATAAAGTSTPSGTATAAAAGAGTPEASGVAAAATGVAGAATAPAAEATVVVTPPAGAQAPSSPAAEAQVVSGPSGQILYGVIGSGGFLGAGAQTTPVPWRLLTYSGVRILALNAGVATLQAAPHVNPGQQPANNLGWDQPVLGYWQKAAPANAGG